MFLWNRHITRCSILHLRLLKDLCHTLTVLRRHFRQHHTLPNIYAMKSIRTAWNYPTQPVVGGLCFEKLSWQTELISPHPDENKPPQTAELHNKPWRERENTTTPSAVTALLCCIFVGLGLWVFLWLGMVWFFGSVFLTGLICLWGSEVFFFKTIWKYLDYNTILCITTPERIKSYCVGGFLLPIFLKTRIPSKRK